MKDEQKTRAELIAELVAEQRDARGQIRALESAQLKDPFREEKYKDLFDNMSEGVAIYEAVDDGDDFVFLDYNRAGEAMDGVPREDALGKRVTEVYPGMRNFGLLEVFRRVWRTGKPERHPVSFYQDDKLGFYRNNYVYKLHTGELVTVYSDETERLVASQALSESQRLLSESQKIAHVGSWSLDVTTHQLTWSDEVFRIFGLTRQVFQPTYESFMDRVHPEDRVAVDSAYSTSLKEERDDYEIVHRVIRKTTGEVRHVHEKCIHYRDATGAIVQSVGMVQDITERVRLEEERDRLEEQFRQAQKMEAVGRLAGGVAHDFNNLLTVINSYAQFAVDDLPVDHPTRADIEQILVAGQRATALTRQLLAFGRKQLLEPRILDLNEVVGGLEKMLVRLIGEDIEFSISPGDGLHRITADPGQIEQVIMNLVVNARDAMPTGGTLTLKTANVDLDVQYASRHADAVAGRYVMLAVVDDGAGMTSEVKEQIFEPFFTTKEKGAGTGLGLATVYGIIRQSGGHIQVQSAPDQGTTFQVFLPWVDAEKTARRSVADNTNLQGSETILVVEDEEGVRKLAHRILESSGYHVITAANGGEALLECEAHGDDIQLVLTDVVMPKMSGRNLADRLAETYPDMKVVFMSGYTDDALGQHNVLDDSVHFIAKPFTLPGLRQKIRQVLDGD